ncbi:unnamed protein product [Effrenium voratum]|nr:unnamed protein product [Effrenium voratum]
MSLSTTISVASGSGSCTIRLGARDLQMQGELLQRLAELMGDTAQMLPPEEAQQVFRGVEFLREQRDAEANAEAAGENIKGENRGPEKKANARRSRNAPKSGTKPLPAWTALEGSKPKAWSLLGQKAT